MQILKNKYFEIIDLLTAEEKKYVSHRSLYNFIIHLEDIDNNSDLKYCIQLIDEYLNDIKKSTSNINSKTAYVYFNTYLYPLKNI